MARVTSIGRPSSAATVPSTGPSSSTVTPRPASSSLSPATQRAETPSPTRIATFRVATGPGDAGAWLSAAETRPWLSTDLTGASTPMPAATATARSWSMRLRCSTIRTRMAMAATLPSSKRYAATMCSFSHADMLFQNRVAWL